MEKLVLYYYQTDDCTYSADIYEPFYYESKEKAEYDLMELWGSGITNSWGEVEFAGIRVPREYLTNYDINNKPKYSEPTILTLDEWFESKVNEI